MQTDCPFDYEREPHKLLQFLGERIPEWKTVDSSTFRTERTMGLTNVVLMATALGKDLSALKCVVKIYGRDQQSFISRKNEIAILQSLKDRAICCPRIIAEAGWGRIEEVFEGANLAPKDYQSPQCLARVGKALERLHQCSDPALMQADCFVERVGEWTSLVLKLASADMDHSIQREFCPDWREWLQEAADLTLRTARASQSEIVLCHNDLHYGNVMENARETILIDFEYGGPNHGGFDLANVLIETMADYNREPHLKLEQLASQWEKVHAFVGGYTGCGAPFGEECLSCAHVYSHQIEPFLPAPLVLWGVWQLLMSILYPRAAFDYFGAALCRFRLYRHFVRSGEKKANKPC